MNRERPVRHGNVGIMASVTGDRPSAGRSGRASTASEADNPPIFEASPVNRDRRRELIGQIEQITQHTLLCYVGGPRRHIDYQDVLYIQELLHFVEPGASIDLLLNSPGGDVDVAEKLVYMIRGVVSPRDPDIEEGELQVIVPDRAKSAATLMALGAKTVVMSDSSELGPIDPQVPIPDRDGNFVWHSVFDYLDAYEQAEEDYRASPDDPVFRALFEKFEPARLHQFRQTRDRVRQCAENLMKPYGGNWTLAPSMLMDTNRFPSHGQMIGWETAKNTIGLNVKFMDGRDSLWRLYWKLYCNLRLAVADDGKVFESSHVSLTA